MAVSGRSQDAAPQAETRDSALAAIRAEVARLEQALSAVSGQADDLLGRVGRTRAEVRLQEARLAEASTALEQTRSSIAESSVTIEILERDLSSARLQLAGRLAAMSRAGGRGYLRLFLAIDRDADLLPALRLLRFLIRRDALVVERYRLARTRLLDEKADLAEQERQAESWVSAESARRSELSGLERRQRRLLADLETRRADLVASADRLTVKETRLARLMEALAAEGGAQLSGVPIQDFQGALDWPAPGAVTREFGPVRDPTYRTTVPHNGLELETTPSSLVRAVYGGRVAFAAPFQDLGFTVVLEHAGRVLTLYAGLSEVLVSEGDVVALEAPVGAAGGRLYFEIRVERHPEDPRDWLL